eukprot:gene10010-biopygen2872
MERPFAIEFFYVARPRHVRFQKSPGIRSEHNKQRQPQSGGHKTSPHVTVVAGVSRRMIVKEDTIM